MASYERPADPPHPDAAWRAHVQRRLRSLTWALVAVAVLTVTALGVAVWALLAEDDDDRRVRTGAIRALEDRVDELEAGGRARPVARGGLDPGGAAVAGRARRRR